MVLINEQPRNRRIAKSYIKQAIAVFFFILVIDTTYEYVDAGMRLCTHAKAELWSFPLPHYDIIRPPPPLSR